MLPKWERTIGNWKCEEYLGDQEVKSNKTPTLIKESKTDWIFLYVLKCHLCDWEFCAGTSTLSYSGKCGPYLNIWVAFSNLCSHTFERLWDFSILSCDSCQI